MKKVICILLSILAITFAVSCAQPDNASSINGGSEPPINPDGTVSGLISPALLSQFRAEIVDATALGIRSAAAGSARGINLSRAMGDQNYLVKTTVEYGQGDIEYDDTELTAVTFTRITTTETSSKITGEKRLVAAGSKDYPHEGTVAFIATEGFVYDLYDENETLIYEGVTDNCDQDYDAQEGVIRLGKLTNGTKYYVRYTGIGVETTVTQDDIDGEIDKVYVLGNYTFISFVPKGTSARPDDADLKYDIDGIATYDKKDYYSNNSRQSFIISNDTGYIYKLEGFNIREIQGGCLLSANDNYIYDFRINTNNELEIYQLFSNDSITWYHVFKDKYGQVFVYNDKIETYDAETKTQFYTAQYTNYDINSEGEAIKYGYDYNRITSAEIVLGNGGTRKITPDESFKIYYKGTTDHNAYKVDNGSLYSFFKYGEDHKFEINGAVNKYNSDTNRNEQINFYSPWYIATYALADYNTLLLYNKERQELRYFSNPLDAGISGGFDLKVFDSLPIVLQNASLSDSGDSFLTYGPYGNTYYEIVVEYDDNGEPVFKSYVSGTYEKPQTKIILQPINR